MPHKEFFICFVFDTSREKLFIGSLNRLLVGMRARSSHYVYFCVSISGAEFAFICYVEQATYFSIRFDRSIPNNSSWHRTILCHNFYFFFFFVAFVDHFEIFEMSLNEKKKKRTVLCRSVYHMHFELIYSRSQKKNAGKIGFD